MWHAAFDKNRPFGAEKSLEPSLILAGERLNDTSCSSLRTWCQADANLLAGDVLLFCPRSSHAPFSILLQFYCCCHPLHCSKMDFLAGSTAVCVSKKWVRCPWSQSLIIIKDMLVAPESEWNISQTAAGSGSGCPGCQTPSILLGPSEITDGIPTLANHLLGKANYQVSDFSVQL